MFCLKTEWRQTDRWTQNEFSITGRHWELHSIVRLFISDLLTIVRLVSLFLSLLPALLPPTFLSLSQRVLSFEVLTSERCIIQEYCRTDTHTHAATHKHIYSIHVHVCWAQCVCCQPLIEWGKLSVSHFSEWLSILVCSCFFFMRVSSCVCVCVCVLVGFVSVCAAWRVEALWQ